MKSQITKIVSLLVCVCLIVSGMILSTSAAESSVSISFANTNARVSQDNNSQVWSQNGITVTNNKAGSSTNVADYSNPVRFYQNSSVTIAYPGMTKIVISGEGAPSKYMESKHIDPWKDSLNDSNASAVVSGKVATITFTNPVDSFTYSSLGKQARAQTITVYYETTGGDGDDNTGAGGTTPPPASSDPAAGSTLTIPEALALGETKDHDNYTAGKYYVEGVVSSVSNETFGNMTIKDANNNSLTIYGSYDADGTNRYDAMTTKPVAGDTVKLYGIIGKYNSTVQMKNAWIISYTPGTPPVDNDPAADTVLTVKAAIELGASKDHNVFTKNKYYVTGEITEIYNEEYGNMKIKDAEGNILTLYGTYNEDGSVRFDALTEKPAVGDTVTVYGIIGQYNGTAQMKNGWFKAAPAGDDNQGGNTDDNQGGNTNTGAGTNTGANTNTNTNTNTGSTTTTTTTPAPEKSPETGDSIALYIVMMAISAAAMVLVAKKRFA